MRAASPSSSPLKWMDDNDVALAKQRAAWCEEDLRDKVDKKRQEWPEEPVKEAAPLQDCKQYKKMG